MVSNIVSSPDPAHAAGLRERRAMLGNVVGVVGGLPLVLLLILAGVLFGNPFVLATTGDWGRFGSYAIRMLNVVAVDSSGMAGFLGFSAVLLTANKLD